MVLSQIASWAEVLLTVIGAVASTYIIVTLTSKKSASAKHGDR